MICLLQRAQRLLTTREECGLQPEPEVALLGQSDQMARTDVVEVEALWAADTIASVRSPVRKRAVTVLKNEIVMHTFVQSITVLALLLLSACSLSDSSDKPKYQTLVPADARDVERSNEGLWQQTSFVVERHYPEFAFPEAQVARLGEMGWRICPSKEKGWSSFVDAASSPRRRVHQQMLKLAKGDESILLAGRYISTSQEALNPRSVAAPDSATQYGMIIWRKVSPGEMKSAPDSSDLLCN